MQLDDSFKFRVWDIKENKFISSTYNNRCNRNIHNNNDDDYISITDLGDLLWGNDADYYPHVSVLNEEDYIIQKCTGFKDSEGKLIFEGDILEVEICGKKFKRVIMFSFERKEFLIRMGLSIHDNVIMPLSHCRNYLDEHKIIGNIYEEN